MGLSLEKLLRQLGVNPGDVAVDVPVGKTAFYGHPGEDTEGSQSFSVASGTELDTRLSFTPGSVISDNNTSAWLNLPDATKDGTGRFVPPGYPASMALLGSVSRARAKWLAPGNQVQPAFVAGEVAIVVFFASKIAPGLGIAAPQTAPGRSTAFSLLSRAVGTYTFIPPNLRSIKGMIAYIQVTNVGAAGNVTMSIVNSDQTMGSGASDTAIATLGITAVGGKNLYVYPGLQLINNQMTNFVLGQTPSISVVVAGNACTFQVDYDLLA